jgi:glycosyltransferase involved in cell wall biosynthesis
MAITALRPSESTQPLVSVIMPVYNAARYLAETLESVVAQTYPHIETVLVDDGSTDASLEIAEWFERRYPGRFIVLRGEPRAGPCRQRNRALESANGSLICWLDADDLWMGDKIAQQVQIMFERPDVGLVYTDHESFESSTGARIDDWHVFSEDYDDLLAQLFLDGVLFAASTIMFRREVLTNRNVRLLERDFSLGDDYHLCLLAALDWNTRGISKVLVRYRRHDANESTRNWTRTNYHVHLADIQRDFLKSFPEAGSRLGQIPRQAQAKWRELASYRERTRGNTYGSVRLLLRSLTLAPVQVLRARFPRSHVGALLIAVRRRFRARGRQHDRAPESTA